MTEQKIEQSFIDKLTELKYSYRPDITDRAALERNFREKFEALDRISLTEGAFARLLDEIVTPDVFTAARTLRDRNAFTRDDGTPLNYKKKITHLGDFAVSFLVKCTLGQMISRYMVLIASEQKLMMRPYQVYQVKPSWTAITKLLAANFKTSPL